MKIILINYLYTKEVDFYYKQMIQRFADKHYYVILPRNDVDQSSHQNLLESFGQSYQPTFLGFISGYLSANSVSCFSRVSVACRTSGSIIMTIVV